MQFRFLAKWFAIGFAVRLVFGLAVFLMMLFVGWEAGMLHLLDLPTVLCIALLEQGPGVGPIGGGDPFYIPLNLFAGVLWGVLFALGASLVGLVRSRRVRVRQVT